MDNQKRNNLLGGFYLNKISEKVCLPFDTFSIDSLAGLRRKQIVQWKATLRLKKCYLDKILFFYLINQISYSLFVHYLTRSQSYVVNGRVKLQMSILNLHKTFNLIFFCLVNPMRIKLREQKSKEQCFTLFYRFFILQK